MVKEQRALRPRLDGADTATDRKEKNSLKRAQRTGLSRKTVDRLELMLALFGWTGDHYTLTFDDDHLPEDFAGVRRALAAFLRRWRRWNCNKPLRYIYCIEGLHGDGRYHIHLIADYHELGPATARYLWRNGIVDDGPVLLGDGGYRRLAEYLNKERTDGIIIPLGRHPWSCSRALRGELPPAERWTDASGVIDIPGAAMWARRGCIENSFGAYYYGSWIEPDESRACARVRARARQS